MNCEGVRVIHGLFILKFVLREEKQKGPLYIKQNGFSFKVHRIKQ